VKWYTPIIPALRRLRQEDHKFKARQGYMVTPCPNQKNKTKQNLGWE
jgi:hypothetical protein